VTQYVAFYLPQFYPFPENNEWWGKGFTEWTNVTKARPLFDGHYQPHLPSDLGFYDLRLRESQHDQISLAKSYGIDAFCFHYYWFSGKRLLDRPVDAFLSDPAADMKFCLCWANENWTRRWDAAEQEVLIAQRYESGWQERFLEDAAPFLRDQRYLTVNGRPLLIVYRPQHVPDIVQTTARWRERAQSLGLNDIHLVAAMTHGNWDYAKFGFDAGVEFPPHNLAISSINSAVPTYEPFSGYFVEYGNLARDYLSRRHDKQAIYRTVFPQWDNTARVQGRALAALGSSPENYERWLRGATNLTLAERGHAEQLVFINAWNEWAEGCHLEPDREYGKAYLEATLRVKLGKSSVDDAFTLSSFSAPELQKTPAPVVQRRYAAKHRVRTILEPYPQALKVATSTYRVLRQLSKSRRGNGAAPLAKLPRKLEVVSLAHSAPILDDKGAFLRAAGDAVFTAYAAAQVPLSREITIDQATGVQNVETLRPLLEEKSYPAEPLQFGLYHECIVHPRAISLITKDGRLIAESARVYGFVDKAYKDVEHIAANDDVYTQTGSAIEVVDEQVIFPLHASFAFGHCVLDALPQLIFWQDEIKRGRMKIGLSATVPAWFQQILGTWGFERRHFLVLPNRPILFRTAIIANALSSLTTFFPHPGTLQQFRSTAAKERRTAAPLRVYLRRGPQTSYSSREIENEDEVVISLEAVGFRSVNPADLPYDEQRELFSNASIVVGAHGSAFANLVWCAPGTKVVDLMPDDWVGYWGSSGITERWLSRLAGACKLDYAVLLCASRTTRTASVEEQPWPAITSTVDVEKLTRLVEASMAHS